MATLKIEIHSFWHAGSGQGRGAAADAVVVRTAAGLPYLPGRTLKGLLRDAFFLAERAGRIPQGRTEELFGKRGSPETAEDTKGLGRYGVDPGKLRISDARLGSNDEERRAWEAWASTDDGRKTAGQFTWIFSSTAIGANGLADHRTLRSVEATVPCTLHAFVEPVDGVELGDWEDDLRTVLPLFRALGSMRSRGFGRCTVTLEEK